MNNTNFDRVNAQRNMGVETGGCSHTAIRENAFMNQIAKFVIEKGGLAKESDTLIKQGEV